jgi:RNA polymerase sigma-70 factor (ECF subfamily)
MTSLRRPITTRREEPRADDVLLRAIADGDLGALGDLYDRYGRDMWRAVHRVLGGGADVDDVVQTVFVKLPKIAPSYDGRTNARAWLVGIAVRVALRHRRGGMRFLRAIKSFADNMVNRESRDPEREATSRDELRRFERALTHISEKKRAVFVLMEVHGLTTDEVARALEIPPATVRTRLFHARRELHDALELRGEGQ